MTTTRTRRAGRARSRAGVRDFALGLRAWNPRRWVVAAAASAGTFVLVAVPTDLIDTPLFVREIPPTWWSYPVLIVTAVLAGLLVASYVAMSGSLRSRDEAGDGDVEATARATEPDTARETEPETSADRRSKFGVAGGVLSFFAVGCPVCNKLVLIALGTSGAIQYFAPLQPILAVASVALLGWALFRRVASGQSCPVPAGARP